MNVINIINEVLGEMINEAKIWYHGTPDIRDLKQTGSFSPKTKTTNYISDPLKWNEIQGQLKDARSSGNEDLYFQLLDQAGKLRKQFTYNKPIYFTTNRNIASTYADPQRAFDYQGSEPTVFQAEINDNCKILTVSAHGKRFRGIDVDTVKQALLTDGVSEEEINKYLGMFPNDVKGNKMTAETLGIIAQLIGYDIVDVLGVLDSYHGGSIQSTVRMVFDPTRIKIINNKINQPINEEIINQLKFKLSNDEDRTTITAYNINNKIGSVSSDILFNSYQYEFDDVFSEEEFDKIYPKDNIIKIEYIEIDDNLKNQGIATKLMGLIMNTMKKRGYTQFYLNASPMGFTGLGLNDLIEFYKKFGFKELKYQGNNVLMGVNF